MTDDVHKLAQLVLIDAGDQHPRLLLGIGAHALPLGHAAAGPGQDLVVDVRLLGEDHQAHVDVLVVGFVQEDGEEHHVDQRVQNHLNVKQHQQDQIDHRVGRQRDLAHAGVFEPAGGPHPDDVKAAAAAPGDQDQADADPGDDAADQHRRQAVLHQRHGGDQAGEQADRARAQNGADQKSPAHAVIGQKQKRQVDEHVDHAVQVQPALGEQGLQKQGDQLGKAHGPAAEQLKRDHKQVHAGRIQKATEQNHGHFGPGGLQFFHHSAFFL